MITVTVYSTAGENGATFNVEAGVSFAQVKTTIGAKYPWNSANIMYMIGGDEVEVRSDNTVMPSGDYCLFVYPKTTKSGGPVSYNAAKRKIGELVSNNREAAHFFAGYTEMSTAQMNQKLHAWAAEQDKKAKEIAANDDVISIADVVKYMLNTHGINYSRGCSTTEDIIKKAEAHFAMPADACQAAYDRNKARF